MDENSEVAKELHKLRTIVEQLLRSSKIVLDVNDVAALYPISKGFLYHLTSKKLIPHYRGANGGKLTFRKDEVDEYFLSNKQLTVEEVDAQAAEYVINHTK